MCGKSKQNEGNFVVESQMINAVNVLHVLDSLQVGGTETQIVQLASRMRAAGVRVAVACLHEGGPLREILAKAEIPVFDFPKPGALASFSGIYQLLRLSQFIRRNKIHAVHSHDLWANLMAVPASRLAAVPVVISSQRDLAHLYWYTPFRRKVIGKIHRWATSVVANSSAVRDLLIDEFLVAAEKVHVIHNGVDLNRFANMKSSRHRTLPPGVPQGNVIVTVANMHSQVKGHFDLIEAAPRVLCEFPKAAFLLVGDGQERDKLENHVKQVGVESAFHFLGQRSDIPEILSHSDLFVLPSRAEGLPNAVLEAMAAELPVVATSVGGLPEIIENGVNGILVSPQAPGALADAILRVLRNPGLAHQLGRQAHLTVCRDFSFDQALERLHDLYKLPACTVGQVEGRESTTTR